MDALTFKKMTKKILIVFLFILAINQVFAGDGYKIRISITNYPDTSLFLTTYYGDKIILIDTAFSRKPGLFEFSGSKKLQGGIYMAVSTGKKKLFEFIVDKNQDFSISTDTINYIDHLKAKGSEENKLFFDYLHFTENEYQVIRTLQDSLQNTDPQSAAYTLVKEKIDSVNRIVSDYKLNIINSKPTLFIATLFNAMREVKIPQPEKPSADSAFAYHYYKSHFWDYFNLSDPRLLHTPLYSRKVNEYIDHLVFVHPDSAIVAVDYLMDKASGDSITIKWMAWQFVSRYQEPKYMGFDKVFVHLVDKYFVENNVSGTTPSIIAQLKKRADALRLILIGKPAPNLILLDTAGSYYSFLNLKNKYILLFFWDYDCSVCKREINELEKIYKDRKIDFEVFAVNVNGDLEKWEKTIRERGMDWVNVNGTRSVTEDFHDLYDIHGTPALFILDANRNIIAKRISATQVIPFLEREEQQ